MEGLQLGSLGARVAFIELKGVLPRPEKRTLESSRLASFEIGHLLTRTNIVRAGVSGMNRALFLVDETVQESKAFKLRGASTAMYRLPSASNAVAASSGSFAIGLAMAAERLGSRVRVFLPRSAPKAKLVLLESLGAEIRQGFASYESARFFARSFGAVSARKWSFISGTHEDVIAGNGTLGLEILEHGNNASKSAVVVPLGIGSLALPLSRLLGPGYDLFVVEPEKFGKTFSRVSSSARPTFATTICDGAAVRRLPRHVSSELIPRLAGVFRVSDEEAMRSMRTLWFDHGIRAEGAGAISLAAVSASPDIFDKYFSTYVIVSGGNIGNDAFSEILNSEDHAI